jgi:excisionase family DNA binding protein
MMRYADGMVTTILPQLLTVEELAELLRLTPAHIRLLIRQGKVPGARKMLHRWLYEEEAVRQWIAHGRPQMPE